MVRILLFPANELLALKMGLDELFLKGYLTGKSNEFKLAFLSAKDQVKQSLDITPRGKIDIW